MPAENSTRETQPPEMHVRRGWIDVYHILEYVHLCSSAVSGIDDADLTAIFWDNPGKVVPKRLHRGFY